MIYWKDVIFVLADFKGFSSQGYMQSEGKGILLCVCNM